MQKTLIHLVIIGISGTNQEWVVGLQNHSTIKVENASDSQTIHDTAFKLADHILNVDQRFLLLKPATFVQGLPSDPINLIFTVRVPQNIKLRDATWVKSSELGEYCEGDANTLRVIAEAVNHG